MLAAKGAGAKKILREGEKGVRVGVGEKLWEGGEACG
jgi:hypothetical protein